MDRFKEIIENVEYGDDIKWSVWEHKKVEGGQRVFLMRCGSVNPDENGIVMSGYFYTEAYRGRDWSGQNRRIYYANAMIDVLIDPECGALLTADKLSEQIPDFDWNGGHSGRYLTEEQGDVLESLWTEYMDSCIEILRPGMCGLSDSGAVLSEYGDDLMRKKYGDKCVICGYDYSKMFPEEKNLNIPIRYMSEFERYPQLPHQCWPICDNCNNADYDLLVNRLMAHGINDIEA